MNRLLAAAAALALFAGAGTASAQMYQPLNPAMNRGAMQPIPYEQTTPWMTDDGSSSDHPVHNPGDISGDRLNAQYQGGIYTTPGHGFPAYPGVYEEER